MLFVRTLYTHSPYRDIFKSPEYVNELSAKRRSFRIVEGFIRGLERFENIYLQSLIDTLMKTDQLHRTIIVISSDHGEMFWDLEDDLRTGPVDPEMWRHQLEPYNALLRVPLLIWGGQMHGVYAGRFRLMDVVPTLLDELGIEYPAAIFDGISARRSEPRPLYADSAGYGFGGLAFQTNGRKILMSRRLGAVEYDISEDDHERLETRNSLHSDFDELLRFVQETSRLPNTIVKEGHDNALMRRLEALGYI
jgi:arylsulfatase A-like enzyme